MTIAVDLGRKATKNEIYWHTSVNFLEFTLFSTKVGDHRGLVVRVFYLRLKGREFETQRRRCVVSLSKTLKPLLSTGSTQKNRKSSRYD